MQTLRAVGLLSVKFKSVSAMTLMVIALGAKAQFKAPMLVAGDVGGGVIWGFPFLEHPQKPRAITSTRAIMATPLRVLALIALLALTALLAPIALINSNTVN
jgi:hypothetical protein